MPETVALAPDSAVSLASSLESAASCAAESALRSAAWNHLRADTHATRRTWLGLAYPLACDAIEARAAKCRLDFDDVVNAFMDRRLLSRKVLDGVVRALAPVAYLRRTATNLVNDEARRLRAEAVPLSPHVVKALKCEPDSECQSGSESGHWAADPLLRLTRLAAYAALQPRDRVVFRASFLGVAALSAEERAWVCERRGVSADTLEREIEEEQQRHATVRAAISRELDGADVRLGRCELKADRLWWAYQVHPSAETESALAGAVRRLDGALARRETLHLALADAHCKVPDRRMIAWLVGEAHEPSELDAAANRAWKQAVRLLARLRKPLGLKRCIAAPRKRPLRAAAPRATRVTVR